MNIKTHEVSPAEYKAILIARRNFLMKLSGREVKDAHWEEFDRLIGHQLADERKVEIEFIRPSQSEQAVAHYGPLTPEGERELMLADLRLLNADA